MEFLLLAASAFGLGALHVLEPGHGKMLVLAYLASSRGRPRDAVVLGLVTAFTHTFMVIILGLLSALAARYIDPERVEDVLGVVASALIISVGTWMIVTRTRSLRQEREEHTPAGGSPEHLHSEPGHSHSRQHGHSHAVPTGPLNLPGLIALGVSGGLVPCTGALVVLLGGISLGARWMGLIFIFSLGMATVLVGIGLAIVKTANYTQKAFQESRWQRYVPLASGYLITLLGGLLLVRALVGHLH